MFQKNLLPLILLPSLLLPAVSFCFQIPEVPPPTRDEEGTRQALAADVNYQRLKRQMEEAKNKKEAVNLNSKGNQAYKAGNWRLAVEYYLNALKKSPNDKVIKQNLLNAKRALASAASQNTNYALFNNKGNQAYKSGDWKQAVEYYRKALQKSPNDKVIKQNLLNAKRALAAENSRKKFASNLNKAGNQAYKEANWERAVEYYKKALKSSPDDKIIKQNLLNAQRALANKNYKKKNAASLNKKGNLAYKLNDWKKAVDYYQKALKNSPDDKVIKQNLLHAQKNLEQKNIAIKLIKQFDAISAKVNSQAPAKNNDNKAVCEQNDLFVKIMSSNAMTVAEKRKYKLKLPVLKKAAAPDFYKDATKMISASQDLFQGNFSNFNVAVNPNAETKGLITITHRQTVEVSGGDNAQKISKALDFIVGEIRLPRASFAVDGGRVYSNVAYNALDRFMTDAMAAVGGHHDSKKFWTEFYDSLSTGQKTTLNWIKFGK